MRWIVAGFLVAVAVACVYFGLVFLALSGDDDQTQGDLVVAGIGFLLAAIFAGYCATWVFRRSPHR